MRTRKARDHRPSVNETAPLEYGEQSALALHFVDDPKRVPLPIVGRMRIGRDPECELRLDLESVSRFHAVIEAGSVVEVRDTGSRNGTFVGRDRLQKGEARPLVDGTSVRIGDAWLLVGPHRSERAAPAAELSDFLRVVDGPMGALFDLVDRLAHDDITVLLTGETGVGKEVLAHYLHARSPRAHRPFVPVHAAALTPSLFESELFGHEKGAFTGANTEHPGLFELAHGGTLFFDEIGELPMEMQPKLLRVLEDRRVTRVGGRIARAADVRIVAATNRNLAEAVASGEFRSDLYFRLSAFPILVPPLRERGAEIPALARALVERLARERGRAVPSISDAAMARLVVHRWPGNVRELRSVLTRALIFATDSIDDEALRVALGRGVEQASPIFDEPRAPGGGSLVSEKTQVAEPDERARIVDALARHAGNQAAAATELGIARRTLLYKLDRLGIPRPRKGQ